MPAHYDKKLDTEFGVTGSDLDAVWHRDAPRGTQAPGQLNVPGHAPTLDESPNQAVLASNGTNPADGDTITVNNVTYRVKATMAQANDVKQGANSDATLDALVKAINQSGASGTDYFAGTVSPSGVRADARAGTGAAARVALNASGAGAAGYPVSVTGSNWSLSAANFRGQGFSGEARNPDTGLRRTYSSNTLTEFGTGEELPSITFGGGGAP